MSNTLQIENNRTRQITDGKLFGKYRGEWIEAGMVKVHAGSSRLTIYAAAKPLGKSGLLSDMYVLGEPNVMNGKERFAAWTLTDEQIFVLLGTTQIEIRRQ